MQITFTNVLSVPEDYAPVPAYKLVPDWYKDLESYMGGEKKTDGKANVPATAKRCMPMFDLITAGYIIVTHCDIRISQVPDSDGETHPYYEWPYYSAITFHPKEQLPVHPYDTGHKKNYPKWMNTWGIKTPPGYSTLFVSPFHRETPILAFPAFVDTDIYTAPVNFPFVLRDPKMEGIIPAGTPIIQVIPVKRDQWQMSIGTQKDLVEQDRITAKLRTKIFDSYRVQYRQLKEYK
jgi:hypothetical protein